MFALGALGLATACRAPFNSSGSVDSEPVHSISEETTVSKTQIPVPDQTTEHSLEGSESHLWTFELEAGQVVTVKIEQNGIDVILRLISPGEKSSTLEMDGPYGSWGPEELSWVSEHAGIYQIEVLPVASEVAPGSYSFWSSVVRPAGDHDRRHAAILANFCRADALRRSKSKNGMTEALALYRGALKDWRQIEAGAWQLQALQRIGAVCESLRDLNGAEHAYREAGELARAYSYTAEEIRNANRLVRVSLHRRDLELASSRLAEVKELAESYGDEGLLTSVESNWSHLLYLQGDIDRATRHFIELSERWQAMGRPLEQVDELHSLAMILDGQGRSDEAIKLLERCVAAMNAGGYERGRLTELIALAGARLRAGDPAGASRDLMEARRSGAENLLGQFALVYLNHFEALAFTEAVPERSTGIETESFEQALRHYQMASKLAEEIDLPGRNQAAIELNFGALYLRVDDANSALSLFESASERIDPIQSPSDLAMVRLGLGLALRRLGRTEEALEYFEQAATIVESERLTSASWDFRMAFLASRHAYFEEWVDLLVDLHLKGHRPSAGPSFAEQALVVVERRRARTLLDSIEERTQLRIEVDAALLEEERGVREKLASLDLEIRGRRFSDRRGVEQKRQDLLLKLDAVRTRIRRQHPQFADVTRPQPISPERIGSQLLDATSQMLIFSLGRQRSFVFHVPRPGDVDGEAREVQVFPLPGRDRLANEVREARKWAAKESADIAARRDGILEGLADLLLKPVYSQLGKERLVLVPDGFLELVPFAALRIPDVGKGEHRVFLLEQHEVAVLPSVGSLDALRREQAARPRHGWEYALFGDPVFSAYDIRVEDSSAEDAGQTEQLARLPYSRQEIDAISSLLNPLLTYRAVDFEARKNPQFLKYLQNSRIVHLATHGIVDSRQPELSALALSLVDESGQPINGYLYAYELYSMKLAADLVVLSACETGVGPEVIGEGVRGLSRAFLYAGTPRLVMSLWNVDDQSTAVLMADFYQKLLVEKMDAPEALREAQLGLLRSGTWSAPSFWAPFVFVGDWQNRPRSTGGADSSHEKNDSGTAPIQPPDKAGAFQLDSADSKAEVGSGQARSASPTGSKSSEFGESLGQSGFSPDRYVNGIDSETGLLLEPHPDAATLLERREELLLKPRLANQLGWWVDHHAIDDPERLPVYTVDPDRIDEAGWAVIYGPDVTEDIKDALSPLLWYRQQQAGKLFKQIDLPRDKVMDSQTFRFSFLDPPIGFGPAVPEKLPYYLMIVGDPQQVPFELQYALDVQYAVGRLHFDSRDALSEYARYAETVKHYERSKDEPPRQAAIFGVEGKSENDRFLIEALVDPVTDYLRERIGKLEGLDAVFRVAGDKKADLSRLLDHPPGLLFAAGHGLGVPNPKDPEFQVRQGALVCSDYLDLEGAGVPPESYFTGDDVGSRDLKGMISFLFACYSAGVPGFDDFPDEGFGHSKQIAPYPMISHLAKRMLAQGAQAVVGHIDRVWGTSFDWSSRTGDQAHVFTSGCHQLLDGARLGHAMEWINQRYAETSTSFDDFLRKGVLSEAERNLMARVRKASLDARNYIIVGDPAARLPGFGGGR